MGSAFSTKTIYQFIATLESVSWKNIVWKYNWCFFWGFGAGLFFFASKKLLHRRQGGMVRRVSVRHREREGEAWIVTCVVTLSTFFVYFCYGPEKVYSLFPVWAVNPKNVRPPVSFVFIVYLLSCQKFSDLLRLNIIIIILVTEEPEMAAEGVTYTQCF